MELQRLSRPPDSAALAPLRGRRYTTYGTGCKHMGGLCYRICYRIPSDSLRFGPHVLIGEPGIALRHHDRRMTECQLQRREVAPALHPPSRESPPAARPWGGRSAAPLSTERRSDMSITGLLPSRTSPAAP